MKQLCKLLAVAGLMAVAQGAMAQSAGQFTIKVGANKITPKVVSGDVSAPALPGSKADVSDNTQPVLIGTYSFTDNISVELDAGLPYKHKISGAGAIQGVGVIGTVEALPPTAFVQYRFFSPQSVVRPYVGLGATYAYFQKETGSGQLTALTNIGGQGTTFKIKNKMAMTLQVGVAVSIGERWFADLTFTKTKLKTQVSFSTNQTQEMTLDPQAMAFGIGYKF
jgi:outer membrane protein